MSTFTISKNRVSVFLTFSILVDNLSLLRNVAEPHSCVFHFFQQLWLLTEQRKANGSNKNERNRPNTFYLLHQLACGLRLLVELSVYYHWMRVTEIFGFAFEKKIVVWLRFVNWSIPEYNGPKSYTMNWRLKRPSKTKIYFFTF